jgi:carbon storage regulator
VLILTRKRDESIVIGDDGLITVTVIGICGDKVKLGIAAPAETPVHRTEVADAIRREREAGDRPA